MSKDEVIAGVTVELILVPGKSVDPGLLEAPLQAFVTDVSRIARGAGQTLERVMLAFVDAQPEINSTLAIASAGINADPSEEELIHEARLARARKLLADIGQDESGPGEGEIEKRPV